ncbi:hypothetical protein ABRS97_23835, partial [Paenibacillus sp. SI92]
MNTLFVRVLSLILLTTLLATSFPIASKVSYAASVENQTAQELQSDATETMKQKLKDSYSISSDDIQRLLDQGYTLKEVESAFQDQKESQSELKKSLSKIKPESVNTSVYAQSVIQSDLGAKDYATQVVSAATTNPVPDFSYVNTTPDTAPYTVKLDQESISTLSGGLSMQVADMSLPGRNGLGFTLTRTYDSGSSQYNQMVTYGDSNGTIQPFEEKFFPIGKGWTWNISYIEIAGSDLYLHLGGAGVYKIVNYNIAGYPWRDLTFTPDTSVTVGAITSAYALHSIKGINQYFDSKGHLIEYVDTYNNTVKFNYTTDPVYGTVLSSITDAIENTINITYSTSKVVLTKGTQTVTYQKTTVNGKEMLSQVVDPIGRTTTYDYYMKDAFFNLLVGTSAPKSNPYALLIGVTHPTGSKTVYTYEDAATVRYTGEHATNQVFRALSREDQVTLSNGTIEHYNHKDLSYSGDMGSSYDKDIAAFSTTIADGLTSNVFTNKKHYIDKNTPSVFYNMSQVSSAPQSAPVYTITTNYIYDESNKYPAPINTQVIKSAQGKDNPFTINTSASYDPFGNVTSSVDALGITTTYTYDVASHLLTGVSKPVSATQTQYTEIERDVVHRNVKAVRVHDATLAGIVLQETKYDSFDAYGNVIQTSVKKDASNFISFQTEYNTAAPYYGAYPTKQTITVKDVNAVPSAIIKKYDYNTLTGQLKTYTDGQTFPTSYEYDAIGRVTKAIHPDNSFVKVDYFDFQNQVQQTDETGVQTVTKWNPLGWKVDAGINHGGIYKSKAKYGYDSYGRLTWTEDALGNHTSYGYDQWSRQNLITYPDTSTESVLYDDVSNTKTSTDAEGYVIKEFYDKGGRTEKKEETKKIAGGGTKTTTLGTFTFDYAGHVLTAKDNQTPQNTTTYNYDTIGRLTSVLNAKNEPTSYQYDYIGNLLQVVYPDGKINLKKYDEIGRLIQTTDANSKVEKFFYDANSNQTGLLDRNLNYFKYTFDNRNFLKSKEITDASWNPVAGEERIDFTYDLAGRRKQMVDGTGTTGYTYNPSTGALSTQTYPDGKTIKYDYDAAGNRFVMNDPFGVNTYYHYDSRNRLDLVAPSADFLKNSSTTDYDAKYMYFNNSLLKQITQRNGVTSEFGYDGLRIGSLIEKKSDGTVLNTFAYTYDNNGNQKTKKEQIGSGLEVPAIFSNFSFSYDSLNRISTSNQFNETYIYDNRGNRTSMTTSNPFDSPDSQRTFDKRDRLSKVALTSGGNVSYKYNGDGLLWERTENGLSTHYYWDGDQIIAEEKDVSQIKLQTVDNISVSINYSGSWLIQYDTNDNNSATSSSSIANTSAQLTFTGTSVAVFVRKSEDSGKADIMLDGVTVATDMDLYANSPKFKAAIYTNNNLTAGSHTIRLTVKGTKNAASTGTKVNLDYFEYGSSSGIQKQQIRYIRGQGLVSREDGQGKAYYLQNGHGDVVELRDSTGNTRLNQ